MDTSGWNMYVFRDGRRLLRGCDLVRSLRDAIEVAASTRSVEDTIAALVIAGELSCGLADADSPYTPVADEITNEIAGALVRDAARTALRDSLPKLDGIEAPERIGLSVQEGFAYYALHPLKFAQVIEQLTLQRQVAVVGIRSIGLTLSAMALAALRARGHNAQRITVRPTGHPYDRIVELNTNQLEWVAERRDAEFLVVDEGPGLSGSSFIAAAEALLRNGVSADRIVLVGTRIPDVNGLRMSDAAGRWARFRAIAAETKPILPEGAEVPLGGGAWRREFWPGSSQWPGSWTQLERLKYSSSDRTRFYRFEGYGHYGREPGLRAKLVASAGFGPEYVGNLNGFGCYEYVHGSMLDPTAATEEVLDRIAAYCAFRGRDFPGVSEQCSELEQMLRFNWKNEFGAELEGDLSFTEGRMIVTDSRMMPHKWIRRLSGQIVKVDSTSHGDDHFFPGPCDIAWDLAGTIVEWGLSHEATDYFLRQYELVSGDRPSARIGKYLLAYATFRLAYSRMAARAMGATEEEPLLMGAYERYRLQALEIERELREPGHDASSVPVHSLLAPTQAGVVSARLVTN
jgi:hypothetical protein